MLSSSPIVDSPKALAIPHYIGQNGCLPSFYVIFTSTHDDLVEMTRHGRWIITNGSSDQCNGWLQLKTNAFIESNGWLFKSHCHSTLAKMVAYQWEWFREGCKKKTSLLTDNRIMENILWGPDRPAKKWLWIFRRCIATQALQRRTLGSKFTRAQFAILSKPKWLYILNSANHFAKQPWLMCTHQIAFSTSFLFCQLSVFRL